MTETVDRRQAHRRGVTVTTVACLTGVAAGLVTSAFASSATDQVGLVVLVGAFLLNLGAIRVAGVDVQEFSSKDHLYTAFMTFALWFITWGILLTSGVTI